MRIGSWAAAVLLALVPVVSEAQPRADVAATTGFVFGHAPRPEVPSHYDDWFNTWLGGVQVGWYLTPHLKLDVDASATGTGTQYVLRYVTVPDLPHPLPVSAEAATSVRSVGGALTWQFRDNEWVHPFVQAGVSTDFERRSVRTWEQIVYPGDSRGRPPVLVGGDGGEGATTEAHLRLLIGGGAKLYVSPRAFIRTDARVTVGRGRQIVALRAAIGVDF